MNQELENLNKEFKKSVEDLGATGFDSDLLNVLKKYVDDRFEILDRKVLMLRDYVFEDENND